MNARAAQEVLSAEPITSPRSNTMNFANAQAILPAGISP
jgi:hypothetical protein